MPFRIDHAAFAARRARAEEIFREALIAREAGRLPEAEKNLRIAITFDPARSELKDALGSVRIELAAGRVEELLARPLDGMDRSALAETLRALEDTLPYQPRHPGLNERAARICLRLGRLEIALEYAGVLLEQMPESSTAYALSGRIREGLGDRDQAIFDFERALEYDTANIEARRALTAARVEARDMARGGRS
jgi:tetratricopeptide (TPR) repeat protein